MEARVLLDVGEDANVGAIIEHPLQAFLRVADRHRQLDSGMAFVEGAQHLGDVVGADGGHLELAGMEAADRVQHVAGLRLGGRQALADGEQRLAGVGQLDAAAATVEQLDLEIVLERLDLAGHRRLADAQGLGGGGEPALAGDRMEGAELGIEHSFYEWKGYKIYIG